MTYTTLLDGLPAKFTAGESLSWSLSFSDYPASDSWVLTYTLINATHKITITASADGDDHLIEVSSETSAAYNAGEYKVQAHISNGTEKYQVDVGAVEILTDYAEETTFDSRSKVKIILDALEDVLANRATKTQLSQAIGNVSVTHWDFEKIRKERDIYAAKYRQEQIRAGVIKSRRTIKVRFV